MSWLTIDLGANMRFGRVMLKQTPADVICGINLQISKNGVNFADLPGAALQVVINRDVNNIAFSPVLARFLRVRIKKFSGGTVGFEDISVHPK